MTRLEERIGAVLCWWVGAVRRRAGGVVGAIALATALLLAYASSNLGLNTDYKELVSDDVPFRRAWDDFARHFPTLDDALLVVIDAETPELAREAADALAARLHGNGNAFSDVFVPGAGQFFESNGLLYLSSDELEALADHLATVQPILAELGREPTLANLARLIRLGLERVLEDGADDQDWPAILHRMARATVAVYGEHPVWISWEDVLLRGSALDANRRRVVVAEPILEYERLLAAARPLAEIRRAAEELGLEPERGVRVRVTGNPALNYEEMRGLLWDVGYAGLFTAVVICGVLYFALRSVRLAAAALVTLAVGLAWTGAFAAATIGRLNLLSIAFAILCLGLGIDFAIHLGLHYENLRRAGESHAEALADAVRNVGASLAICTVTTAIGFYAFVPTDFRGVAELGLIGGTGMFVIFFLTLTLYPALLELWLRDKADWPAKGSPSPLARLSAAEFHPAVTCSVAGAAALGAALLLPGVRFDANVVEMRDPDTESVQTFRDLLAASDTTPWQVDLLAPDLESARALAARVAELDSVERAVTLADYVPDEQQEKMEILTDLALLFDVPSAPDAHREPLPVEEQIAALRDLHAVLDRPWLAQGMSPFEASARRLRAELARFLARVEQDPRAEDALASLESTLLGRLPAQLERIQRATQPTPFGLEDLPPHVVHRMLAADGSARVRVFPREDVSDSAALARFVDEVGALSPDATGLAANMVGFSRATARSLRRAFAVSLVAVAVLLWLLWRRMAETALVLTPILLGAALAGASLAAFDAPFNYANVVALPLLLGMGVDSGIHLVHRGIHLAPRGGPPAAGLAGTVTARAVFYSALTTVTSFGSLVFSSHPGLASLGTLLVVGMVLTLLCNLLVLPALIRVYRGRGAR